MPARHIVRRNEQFVRRELGCAVEIDWLGGLVCRECNDLLDIFFERGLDNVFGSVDCLVLMHSIGLYSAAGTCFSAAA